MRKWLMILMAVLLSLSMAACSGEEADVHEHKGELQTGPEAVQQMMEEQAEKAKPVEDKAVVGTWKGSKATYTFEENGTGMIVVAENGGSNNFYYTAKDGKMTITVGETILESTYTITDGKMKMVGGGSADTYTLVK